MTPSGRQDSPARGPVARAGRLLSGRRATPFGAWVHAYGPGRLAADLGLSTRWPIYQWLSGVRTPRPNLAIRMVTIAGGWISLGDIYAQRTVVQGFSASDRTRP